MYTFTKNSKLVAVLLMAIGVVALGYGFMKGGDHPSDEDVKQKIEAMAASMHLDHGHGRDHGHDHGGHGHDVAKADKHDGGHGHEAHHVGPFADLFEKIEKEYAEYHIHFSTDEMMEAHELHDVVHATEHFFHARAQRPWSNLFLGNFFFFVIALGSLFFLSIQYAAEVGWSALILRVPQALSSYLLVGGIILLFVIIAGSMHWHHLYHWMDSALTEKGNPEYDKIIAGKSGYLNVTFFLIRSVIYIAGWIWAANSFKKFSVNEDLEGGTKWHFKSYKRAALFLVFFAVTSSMAAWDWVMSVDPHWFSTLFGWYVFSSFFVSAATAVALLTIHLKKRGYLPHVNENHYHDFGRFMLSFSIFWTYLWFAQFMLYWYANIPEEVTYFMVRINEYKIVFIGMLAMNFLGPVLFLMSRDSKRSAGMLTFASLFIIVGHYLDMYVMIMPGSVGTHWHLGFVEIGSFLGFLGLFIYVVLNSLTKRPLVQENHPMLLESKHHHI